ncbi:MAG: electron transfer flavoprotein subunit beta/FixA family protein [Bacillota bacterium]
MDPATRRPVQGSAKLVMDSYAEYALEVAIQLKEKHPGSQVVALCVGDKPADDVLRRAYALTADEAVRVWDPAWADLDSQAVAHILARTIQQLGGADLVLTGREAGDIERGVVGPTLAEELGYACATIVARVEAVEGKSAVVRREVDGGYALVSTRLPAVLTITNDETNVPRLPKVKDLMMAARKPITVLGAADLDLDPARLASPLELVDLYIPVQEGQCEIIEGDDGPAKAAALARRLHELKLV